MSVFKYNNVTLPQANVTQFTQEAVYEESNTDRYVTKYDIQVQTVLNFNYLALIAPDLIGVTQNPADTMQIIRQRLLKPRKTLSVKFGGHELVTQKQDGLTGTVDAQNGPLPQRCIITQLTNTTFLCTYSIIAHFWENNSLDNATPPVTNVKGSPILFNRWSETVDIDNTNMSTYTREGLMALRSDNPAGIPIDFYRSALAITGQRRGFIRTGTKYSVSPDGLRLRYALIDKEVFKMPPAPAYEADGEYVETHSRAGAKRYGEVRVALKGAKNIGQHELVRAAMRIASRKLSINSDGPIQVLESFQINVKLYENVVEVRARALLNSSQQRVAGMGGTTNWAELVATPFSDGNSIPPVHSNVGTGLILLQAAAYFDPNLQGNHFGAIGLDKNTNQMQFGLIPGQAGAQVEV